MMIVTYVAQLLAAVLIGGVCVMMYFDMPFRAPPARGGRHDAARR